MITLTAGMAFCAGLLVSNVKSAITIGHLTVLGYHLRHPPLMLSGHPAPGYRNEMAVAEWMKWNGLNDALVSYLTQHLNDPISYIQIGSIVILQEGCGEDALRALPEINRLIASRETDDSVREDLRGMRKHLLDRYCAGGPQSDP